MLQNVQRGPNVAGDSQATAAGTFSATASGTVNTMGSWTQVFASTTVNSQMLVLQPDDVWVSATNTSSLVDIGIGGAGSETVLIASVNLGGLVHGQTLMFPIQIKKGTRVSLRCQSVVASKVIAGRINLVPAAGLEDAGQVVDTYGAVTGSSTGTALPTGVASSAKTAWVQVTASTTRDTAWITWSLATAGTNINATKGGFDIGYGGAGSETVLVADARWEQLGTEQMGYSSFIVPCNIPAGTRLAVRWDSTGVAAGSVINAIVHCIT